MYDTLRYVHTKVVTVLLKISDSSSGVRHNIISVQCRTKSMDSGARQPEFLSQLCYVVGGKLLNLLSLL